MALIVVLIIILFSFSVIFFALSVIFKLSATLLYVYYRFFASERSLDEAYFKTIKKTDPDYRKFEKDLEDLLKTPSI